MLYIRVDGNSDIGMGHVMRCLSIAEAITQLNQECVPIFITADEGCRALIEEKGFKNIVLHTNYKDMMSELSILECIFDARYDNVLVDSYQVSSKYFLALRKLVWVACLEDMGQAYPVNLLINYNIYAPNLKENYQILNSKLSDSRKLPDRVLLGLEYMPLRRDFQKPAVYHINDKVTDVIITTGGSDPCFAAAALADAFIENSFLSKQNMKLHIISGPFNRFSGELNREYGDCKSIVIHENVKDMRGLFLQSDVVISAAGSTIYEISALGVPMIIFYFVENQRQGAETFAALTDILNAGCFSDEGRIVADRTMEALERCVRDKNYRESLYRQEKKLIDGKGAYRIAKQLILTAKEISREYKKGKEL